MDFKFDKSYPPEYAYLEDFVEKANAQLKKMDMVIYRVSDKMKEVPFEWTKPPEDDSAIIRITKNNRRARALNYLEDKQAAYRREILEIVSQETASADPRIQRWVRQSASFSLDLYDERVTRHRAQNMNPHDQNTASPKEKMYKVFSELPSIRKEEMIIEKKLERPVDAITESLAKADEITRMVEDAKKRRQASQHRRGGHRR